MILEDCPSDAGTNPPRVAEESELPKVEAEEEEALFRSWSALKSFSQLAMASEEGEDEAEEEETRRREEEEEESMASSWRQLYCSPEEERNGRRRRRRRRLYNSRRSAGEL